MSWSWIKNLSNTKKKKVINQAWYNAECKYAIRRDIIRKICEECCHILLLEHELKKNIK